jgi:hypothetical protein
MSYIAGAAWVSTGFALLITIEAYAAKRHDVVVGHDYEVQPMLRAGDGYS